MAYDQAKDKVLKHLELETSENNFMTLSIFSYDGGVAKVQYGRYSLKNGEPKYMKIGRMSIQEIEFVNSHMEEILVILKENKSEMD